MAMSSLLPVTPADFVATIAVARMAMSSLLPVVIV
jgi:hypothetical protein